MPNLEDSASIVQNHPIYWFHDGNFILDVEVHRFRVHRTLLSRHSRFFSALSDGGLTPSGEFPKLASGAQDVDQPSEGRIASMDHVVVEPKLRVRSKDVEALLQHLYHDMPLTAGSPFPHVASILRVSSPQQFDLPELHLAAREIAESKFPNDPAAFTHHHPLHDALDIVTDFNLFEARKAILYSLVTTTDFDACETACLDPLNPPTRLETQNQGPVGLNELPDSRSADGLASNSLGVVSPVRVLSKTDAEVCMALMARLIDYFTPALFTPAATPHMACTDVFAETWMNLVIQPALEDGGVYKPLETLQRMKEIDWRGEGLCPSCVVEKRDEWTGEQRTVWRLMDDWLGIQSTKN